MIHIFANFKNKINNNLTTHTSNKSIYSPSSSIPPAISTHKIHNRTKFMEAKACMQEKTQPNIIFKKKIRSSNNNARVTLAYRLIPKAPKSSPE
jgi:hypothetical protein